MKKKNLSIKYKRNRIRKLIKENKQIDSLLYPSVRGDLYATIYFLKNKKEQKIRSYIIELHLAFENILDYWIEEFLIKGNPRIKDKGEYVNHTKTKTVSYINELIKDEFSLGFRKKLLLVRAMGFIDDRYYKKLISLNKLRNACGHEWILEKVIRKGKKRHKKKKRLLEYKGKNLFKIEVFEEFFGDYGKIYLKII